MSELPKDAKEISGFTEFGLDRNGNTAFFGFKIPGEDERTYAVSQGTLAAIIAYLQHIAETATQRRLARSIEEADMDARSASYNRASIIHFDPDPQGESVLLYGSTVSGIPFPPVQLPFDLVEELLANLPSLIVEMKNRQSQ